MKNRPVIWSILAGMIVGAISYWRMTYDDLNLLETRTWLLMVSLTLIGSVCLALYFHQKPWMTGICVTLGVIIALIMRITFDVTFQDSTSHNLVPFEIVLVTVQSLAAAFAGAYIAQILNRRRKARNVSAQ